MNVHLNVLPLRELAPTRARPTIEPGWYWAMAVPLLWVVWSLTPLTQRPWGPAASALLFPIAELLALGWALARPWSAWRKRCHWARLMLVLSLLAVTGGQCLMSGHLLLLGSAPRSPWWSDVGYLLYTPLAVAGVVLMPGLTRSWLTRGRYLMESLILFVGVLVFAWVFHVGPVCLTAQDNPWTYVMTVGYAVNEALLIACGLMLLRRETATGLATAARRLGWALLLMGVGTWWWNLVAALGMNVREYPWLALFPAGVLLQGWVCAELARGNTACGRCLRQDAPREYLRPSYLPYLVVAAVAGLEVAIQITGSNDILGRGLDIGVALLMVLVVTRQILVNHENAALYRNLQEAYRRQERLAATDEMTGLANYRAFSSELERQMQAVGRHSRPVSLLLIDVDRFKHYNDTHGHPAGNVVLQELAALLRRELRGADLAARYGGEEFAVILPDSDTTTATHIATRLCQAVARHHFPHDRVTVSIGLACTSITGVHGELLTRCADAALYRAKAAGRNRIAA